MVRNIQVLHECKDARNRDCAARRDREGSAGVVEEGDRLNDAGLDYDAGDEEGTHSNVEEDTVDSTPHDPGTELVRILNAAGIGTRYSGAGCERDEESDTTVQ
jgi:hypothetical protein